MHLSKIKSNVLPVLVVILTLTKVNSCKKEIGNTDSHSLDQEAKSIITSWLTVQKENPSNKVYIEKIIN